LKFQHKPEEGKMVEIRSKKIALKIKKNNIEKNNIRFLEPFDYGAFPFRKTLTVYPLPLLFCYCPTCPKNDAHFKSGQK